MKPIDLLNNVTESPNDYQTGQYYIVYQINTSLAILEKKHMISHYHFDRFVSTPSFLSLTISFEEFNGLQFFVKFILLEQWSLVSSTLSK